MLYDWSHIRWSEVSLKYPWALLALLLLPVLIYFWRKQKQKTASIQLSSLQSLAESNSWKVSLMKVLPYLKFAALGLILVCLSRPQELNSKQWSDSEGYNIMLCMDVSWSMMARDFSPNRLEVAKELSEKFVSLRKGDRIGLVEFESESFLKVPLTTDHLLLSKSILGLESGRLKDGTALGDAMATAIDRIKDVEAKTKIIILLTDGDENSGYIDAGTATNIAKTYGVKVYTIGMGTDKEAVLPMPPGSNMTGSMTLKATLNEPLLKNIARETGAKYFRARSDLDLKEIYSEINQLEKNKIKNHSLMSSKDVFMPIALWALILLVLEFVLRYGILKSKP